MKSIKNNSSHLILLITVLFLLSPEQGHAINVTGKEFSSGVLAAGTSLLQHEANPRKKVKKKRRTILDRKHKMGKGRNCPSF